MNINIHLMAKTNKPVKYFGVYGRLDSQLFPVIFTYTIVPKLNVDYII